MSKPAKQLIAPGFSYDVQVGHSAVWVNTATYCIGRFGRFGIDVHRTLEDQERGHGQCLDCTHSRVTVDDWERFKNSMKRFHNVDLGDMPPPAFCLPSPTARNP